MSGSANVYLLKDLSRLSGHSIYTLKFYIKLGLIHEFGRSPETRFRYFDDSSVERLATIRALRKQRKSLSEIQRLLSPVFAGGKAFTEPHVRISERPGSPSEARRSEEIRRAQARLGGARQAVRRGNALTGPAA